MKVRVLAIAFALFTPSACGGNTFVSVESLADATLPDANAHGDAATHPEAGTVEAASPDAQPRDSGTGDACPAGQQCGAVCCGPDSACVTGSAGASCVKTCASNAECKDQATPCCQLLKDGRGVCAPLGSTTTQQCRCNTSADCAATACCAPALDGTGSPRGPYVCKPDDGEPYDCCDGVTVTCTTDHCCVGDDAGNNFCAVPCMGPSDCSPAECDAYTFSVLATTCSGPTACGP
jgi:hypothetical protein